jgi:membrane-associated phospholipid phosphatase
MSGDAQASDDVGEPTPAKRFGVRAILAFVALAMVAVPFGLLLLLVRARWSPLLHLDQRTSEALHRFAVRHDAFVSAMKSLSTIGSSRVYVPVFAALVAWLLWRRLPRLALFVAVTVAGSILLNNVVKVAVDRARPVLPDPVASAHGKSFPSGHSQAAVVTYAVLLLVFLPVLRGPCRILAYVVSGAMVIGIGFSRVALGVHFTSDVLAGYVLGAAWVLAMTAAFSAWRRDRGRPAVHAAEGLEPEHADRLDPVHDAELRSRTVVINAD